MWQALTNIILRPLLTVLLLAVAVTLAGALAYLPVAWRENWTALPLVLGFGGGLLFFTLISRFLTVYVFGHELTHFLVAKLFRRRTGKFRLGTNSGSVAVERPNIWITLAPYFVPVYTLLWIGIYGVVDFIWNVPPQKLSLIFAVGVGVTYSFHVRLTLYALARQQSDLRRYGRALSLAFIASCNIILLYVGVVAATGRWDYSLAAIDHSVKTEWRVLQDASRLTGGCLVRVREKWTEMMHRE